MGKSISPNGFAMLRSRYNRLQAVLNGHTVVGELRRDDKLAALENIRVLYLTEIFEYAFELRQIAVHLNVANINEFYCVYVCTHSNPPPVRLVSI
jgi:hypothetical protein